MALNQTLKNQIIEFVASMKQTGENVHQSLIFYANSVAQDDEEKYHVSRVIEQIAKGSEVEDALLEEQIINEFQYAILMNSADKNKAFDRILYFDENRFEADKFYFKEFSTRMLVNAGVFLGMPWVVDIINKQVNQVKGSVKDFHINAFSQFFFDIRDYYSMIGILLILLWLAGIAYYLYTYNNELPTHYKYFKLKAYNETEMYLTLIDNMLASGAKSYRAMELLGTFIIPASARDFFLEIGENITKNKDLGVTLRQLGFLDTAIFNIQMAQETNDFKKGFSNALKSTKKFIKNNKEKQMGKIELMTLAYAYIPYSILLTIISFAMVDIAFLE